MSLILKIRQNQTNTCKSDFRNQTKMTNTLETRVVTGFLCLILKIRLRKTYQTRHFAVSEKIYPPPLTGGCIYQTAASGQFS